MPIKKTRYKERLREINALLMQQLLKVSYAGEWYFRVQALDREIEAMQYSHRNGDSSGGKKLEEIKDQREQLFEGFVSKLEDGCQDRIDDFKTRNNGRLDKECKKSVNQWQATKKNISELLKEREKLTRQCAEYNKCYEAGRGEPEAAAFAAASAADFDVHGSESGGDGRDDELACLKRELDALKRQLSQQSAMVQSSRVPVSQPMQVVGSVENGSGNKHAQDSSGGSTGLIVNENEFGAFFVADVRPGSLAKKLMEKQNIDFRGATLPKYNLRSLTHAQQLASEGIQVPQGEGKSRLYLVLDSSNPINASNDILKGAGFEVELGIPYSKRPDEKLTLLRPVPRVAQKPGTPLEAVLVGQDPSRSAFRSTRAMPLESQCRQFPFG